MKGDKTIYRIVKDSKSYGYEIQVKSWWWPFWVYIGFKYITIEEAEYDISLLKKPKKKNHLK